jgi:hypothetical protein
VKDYREIRPDFTVDKFTDGQAPTANINSFQKLVNFIPKSGRIQTRLGIGELVHTPDTSGDSFNLEDSTPGDPVSMSAGNNPADFATIQAIMNFNQADRCALTTNILNGVKLYMSAGQSYHNNESGGVTGYTADKIEGTQSLIMTENTALNTEAGEPNRNFGFRSANAFEEWMPGHASGVTGFMITYWVYPFNANAGANSEWHFCFGNAQAGTGNLPWYMRHFDTTPQWACSNSAGGNLTQTMKSGTMAQNTWQFVAAWHDYATGFRGFYHYNRDTQVEVSTASEGVPTAHHYYISSSYNTINAHSIWNGTLGQPMPNISDAYHGLMDYMTMWSKPMHLDNSSNITLVRWIRDLHA